MKGTRAFFLFKQALFFTFCRCPLGSLQRINTNSNDINFWLGVCCKVTYSNAPLRLWLHIGLTKLDPFFFHNPSTASTFINYRLKISLTITAYSLILHPTPPDLSNTFKTMSYLLKQ